MLLHVVMWRLGERSDAALLKAKLAALEGCVSGLLGLEVGVAFEEGVTDGADVVLVSRFTDAAALAAYAAHPQHQALAEWLRPRRSERRVVDALL